MVSAEETCLVDALRRGDEGAFRQLLDQYHATMVRIATTYVGSRSVAEEVAQDAWLGVLRGIHRFEGRSSFKTWLFTILINRARSRARREQRSVPFSRLQDDDPAEPTVDPDRFFPADHPHHPHHWSSLPASWDAMPDASLLSQETMDCVRAAIQQLPARQREVILLRDVEGWTTSEVCNILDITESNQRVLLHRARAKVRRALEQYFSESEIRSTIAI